MNQTLEDKIDPNKIPQHVAIIMDGNGRWAKNQGFERTFGHQNAVIAVKETVEGCRVLGIKNLTLYAFSTENWSRPKIEVNFLMKLLSQTIQSELNELHENGIRIKIIGEFESLPSQLYQLLQNAEEFTKQNTEATLTIALSYGSRNELLRAIKNIAKEVQSGQLDPADINESVFEENLYTNDLPNVDLLIRTSGEYRISNFLLWQIAYAELYFTNTLWPDFRKEDLFKAVFEYSKRERRFGKTGEQTKNA